MCIPAKCSYHTLFNVITLCHLDKSLEQSAVVLDENLTGLTVSTLDTDKRDGKTKTQSKNNAWEK